MITAFMLFQSASALTLSELAGMSPARAGALVLRGERHGPIEEIVPVPATGLALPNVIERQLVERAIPTEQGCLRRRWTVDFYAPPGKDVKTATLRAKRSATEIALSSSGKCPSGQYVLLNVGVDVRSAFDALTQLKQIRSGVRKVQFACFDETSSDLCSSAEATRSTLQKVAPWALSRSGVALAFWLGTPGHVVTEVQLDPQNPDNVTILRRIPAPS